MESGTAQASAQAKNGASANGGGAELLEVLNPATGESITTVAVDTPQSVAETVARVRANQPAWEALGNEGRYHWLGKLRDWLLDHIARQDVPLIRGLARGQGRVAQSGAPTVSATSATPSTRPVMTSPLTTGPTPSGVPV